MTEPEWDDPDDEPEDPDSPRNLAWRIVRAWRVLSDDERLEVTSALSRVLPLPWLGRVLPTSEQPPEGFVIGKTADGRPYLAGAWLLSVGFVPPDLPDAGTSEGTPDDPIGRKPT